ncbi:MAG: class I SAM-dependent methyltransferase [Firmicutes bacterium]|nr:class I SAM-dependent methyltransferase [Bacillota bacterium]
MEHYFSNNPTSRSDEQIIRYTLADRLYLLMTDHGVFSMDRVDKGSDLLIRTVLKAEEDPASCMDIGCGYGPIGLILADRWPASEWQLVDVNDRAMELAGRNAAALGLLGRVQIGPMESFPADDRREVIVTNPPIRAGKQVIYGLFREAWERLAPGGRLYIVIRKNQGADSAAREIRNLFGNCETVGREAGYHVLRAEKSN